MATLTEAPALCARCKQPITLAPRRVCALCGGQIGRHHKGTFNNEGRVEHRHCDNPESYLPAKGDVS